MLKEARVCYDFSCKTSVVVRFSEQDWNKVVVGYQQLAQIAASTGNVDAARGELERALKVAESIKNPEMRKKIKEQMRDLKRG